MERMGRTSSTNAFFWTWHPGGREVVAHKAPGRWARKLFPQLLDGQVFTLGELVIPQHEALRLVLAGLPDKEIGAKMFLSFGADSGEAPAQRDDEAGEP
jgi:hypothetical protein